MYIPTSTRTSLYDSLHSQPHSNDDSNDVKDTVIGTDQIGGARSIRMKSSVSSTSTNKKDGDDDLLTQNHTNHIDNDDDDDQKAAASTASPSSTQVDVVYPFNDDINMLVEQQTKGNHNVTTTTTTENSNIPPHISTAVASTPPTEGQQRQSQDRHDGTDLSTFTIEERKKIRVAKAHAEIDRILLHPDGAPFDVEVEMKNVIAINCETGNDDISIISSSSTDDGTSTGLPILPISKDTSEVETQIEMIMDRQEEMSSYDIEGQLYDAIRKQDYTTAAIQQKALQQLQYDATIQVLQCNSAFYKAFSKKDYKSMELLWLPNDKHVLCIHPSHVPIVSSYNINQSWQQMFTSSSNSNFQKTWIEPTNIRINVRGNNMAIVTCDEQVYIRRFVRGQKRQTELINTLTATNIYYKLQHRWYMIHHHASWHPNSDAAKTALSRSTTSSSSSSSAYIASLKKRQETLDAQNDGSDNNNNFGLDGILGMKGVGPLLGDLKPKKLLSPGSQQQQQNPPPQRRIVMGSLSDILNGNLEDLLNGGSSNKNSDKKGNDDEASAIIQFRRIESDDDDDDDDDDDIEMELDDDEDEDEDDDEDDDEEGEVEIPDKAARNNGKKEAISMIHEWASRRGKDDEKVNSSPSTSSSTSKKQSDVDMTMKKQCLTLIRQLCAKGLISQQHKRTLITEMISSSATSGSSTPKKSQIQLAYEFLVASHDDENSGSDSNGDETTNDTMYDIAREEFADQCRIIAESLSSQS